MTYFIKHLLIFIIIISITGCSKNYHVVNSSSKNEAIINIDTDSISENIIIPYRKQMESMMSEVLNTAEKTLEVGSPEGLLGNFITDLVLLRAQKELKSTIDFAMLNNGGLRVPINEGEVTRGEIYELMPFDNEIAIVEIQGEKVIELIEYVRKKTMLSDPRKSGVPISGLRMRINDANVEEVYISGIPFDRTRTYKIATSDYLSRGGDHMDFFLNPVGYEMTGVKLRDAILDHIIELKEKGITINASFDGRVQHAE